ncbi:MAG: S8 family peptidase [Planctomycetota bacterium]
MPGSVIVKFKEGVGENLKLNCRALASGTLRRAFRRLGGMENLSVSNEERAVQILRRLPFVEYAELDYVVDVTRTPNDQFYSLQYGFNNTGQQIGGIFGTADADIDAPEAWDITTGSSNVVIAVIDSGVQWDHPDLAANIWNNSDEIAGNGIDDDGNGYVDDVRGWDFYSNDNNPDDADGHGSHVAGTIAAVSDNSIGVAGTCWNCTVMPLRFIGPFGGATSDAIAAINYAVANGAQISNNSWGGGGFSTALRDAIANAGNQGHLFVSAAGNDGRNTDSQPAYPGSYDLANILNVANITNTDTLWTTSNYGATSVDIGAPGHNVASTYNGDGYVYLTGTSMASPHAAGVAGLVLSANPSYSWSQIKSAIVNNTRSISALSGVTVTGGALNAVDALNGGGGAPPPPPPPASGPPNAPSGLNAANQGGGVTLLTWTDNSNNEDGFEAQWQRWNGSWGSTSNGTVGADVTSATAGVGSGWFRFRIRAFNSDGNSSFTGWDIVRVY